jgi:acyl-coenzyme A synthetase/AMP-(fatty) acid ligase
LVPGIEEEQLTSVILIGILLRDVVNLPHLEQRDLSSVQFLGRGGSATSPGTLSSAAEAFPQAVVAEAYAQTESGMVLAESRGNTGDPAR